MKNPIPALSLVTISALALAGCEESEGGPEEPYLPGLGSACSDEASVDDGLCPEGPEPCRCPSYLACRNDVLTGIDRCQLHECYTSSDCVAGADGARMECLNGACLPPGAWLGEGNLCNDENPCLPYLRCVSAGGADDLGTCHRFECYRSEDCGWGWDVAGDWVHLSCVSGYCHALGCG